MGPLQQVAAMAADQHPSDPQLSPAPSAAATQPLTGLANEGPQQSGGWAKCADGDWQHQQQEERDTRHSLGRQQGSNGSQPDSSSSNIVPFPGCSRRGSSQAGTDGKCSQQEQVHQRQQGSPRGMQPALPKAPLKFYDDVADTRPLLLFDMNGTLTSHTAARRSAGRNLPRPGTHHLRRLSEHFRIGVFTSATMRTVQVAVDMLEAAAGQGAPIFDRACILHRDHTLPVPDMRKHVVAGGKPWDTIKPLHLFFRRLHRVLIVDDDAYKASPGEESNMVLVPRWEHENPQDQMVQHIVEALLTLAGKVGKDPEADLRPHTQQASQSLAAIAEQLARACSGPQAAGVPSPAPSSREAEQQAGQAHR